MLIRKVLIAPTLCGARHTGRESRRNERTDGTAGHRTPTESLRASWRWTWMARRIRCRRHRLRAKHPRPSAFIAQPKASSAQHKHPRRSTRPLIAKGPKGARLQKRRLKSGTESRIAETKSITSASSVCKSSSVAKRRQATLREWRPPWSKSRPSNRASRSRCWREFS